MKFYTNVCRVGGSIFHRGYEDSKPFVETVKYSPYLFINSKEDRNTKYSSLDGRPVTKIEFESSWELKKWREQHDSVEGFRYFGSDNPVTTFIYDRYAGEISFDPSLIRVGIIDIECHSSEGFPDPKFASSEITAICLKFREQFYVFGIKDFVAPKNVKYFKCRDEESLLKSFLAVYRECSLEVLSGWNLVAFDIPYLVNRIVRILGEDAAKTLSPVNRVYPRKFKDKYQEVETYEIVGISVLDYMEMYKKFTLQVHGKLESYSLNYVMYFELEQEKLDYSEFKGLDDMYENNPQKYFEYNIRDVDLIARLDNKLRFFDLIFTVAYIAKTNYPDVLKTIPVWDSLIHAYLMDRRIVVPAAKSRELEESIPGGYVKEPVPGMYEWVLSFDVASMYPTNIMQYNISPEKTITKKMLMERKRKLHK